MDVSCNFSFWDLYVAAFGKAATPSFRKKFVTLSQDMINKKVMLWANKAGWKTEKRIGSDKKLYIAFYP